MRTSILVLILFGSIPGATHPQADVPEASAPTFALKDSKGRTVRLSDFKGKVVMLNFWATWCVPCRAEMPDLVKLQREFQSRGLQVIGITYPAFTSAEVQRVIRRMKINYPILLDTRAVAKKYEVGEVLPTTIVIDREGRLRARILGILEPEEFDKEIKPLL